MIECKLLTYKLTYYELITSLRYSEIRSATSDGYLKQTFYSRYLTLAFLTCCVRILTLRIRNVAYLYCQRNVASSNIQRYTSFPVLTVYYIGSTVCNTNKYELLLLQSTKQT